MSMPDERHFGIKKFVPSDHCDSKPGKKKKTVTIMASTSRASRKTPPARGKETKYKCKQCDFPLCRVGCFLEYHQQRNVEVQN